MWKKAKAEGRTLLDVMRVGTTEGLLHFDGEIEKLTSLERQIDYFPPSDHISDFGGRQLRASRLDLNGHNFGPFTELQSEILAVLPPASRERFLRNLDTVSEACRMLAARPPLAIAALIVGAFAIFHGHAHGAELPPGGWQDLWARCHCLPP